MDGCANADDSKAMPTTSTVKQRLRADVALRIELNLERSRDRENAPEAVFSTSCDKKRRIVLASSKVEKRGISHL
jgi:hypothetical protein